jgi:hypothetical protein
MLDNVLDVTVWPLREQRAEAMAKRRIGLGFLGLGSALVMLGIRYNAKKGYEFGARVAETLRDTAYVASIDLADDPVDPICNSTVYARALDHAGVPAEVHLFAEGGHAFGLRDKEHPISLWPMLVENWRKEIKILQPQMRRKVAGQNFAQADNVSRRGSTQTLGIRFRCTAAARVVPPLTCRSQPAQYGRRGWPRIAQEEPHSSRLATVWQQRPRRKNGLQRKRCKPLFSKRNLVGPEGFEPSTNGLRVRCSTN